MCQFLEVSRSGYYDYVKRMDIPPWDLPLAEKLHECQQHSHSTYGYRAKIRSHEEARLFMAAYIHFYNHERIQLKTKLTSMGFRSQFVA